MQQTRDRFQVGEVTRTDVAQAESSLASGTADVAVAESSSPGQHCDFSPRDRDPAGAFAAGPPDRKTAAALARRGDRDFPCRTSVDPRRPPSGRRRRGRGEGRGRRARRRQLSVVGQVQNSTDTSGYPGYSVFSASIGGQLTVPIYQGGQEYAAIRQAKEKMNQAQIAVAGARNQARAAVVTAWGQLAGGARRDHVLPGGGQGGGNRAEWRARGSQGRPAHHARRAQRRADPAQHPRATGAGPARPGGRLL